MCHVSRKRILWESPEFNPLPRYKEKLKVLKCMMYREVIRWKLNEITYNHQRFARTQFRLFFNFSNFLLNCLYTLSSFNMCIWNVFCPLQYAHVPYLVPKTLVWRYRRTAALKVVYWAVWKVRQWDLPPIAWRPLYNSCLLLSVRAVRAYIYVQAHAYI